MTGPLQILKQKRRGSLSSTSKRVMGLKPTLFCLEIWHSTPTLDPHFEPPALLIFGVKQVFISITFRILE